MSENIDSSVIYTENKGKRIIVNKNKQNAETVAPESDCNIDNAAEKQMNRTESGNLCKYA